MTKSYAGLGLAMATALLLTACSKSPGVGHYKLDTEHFADHFTELLIDNGKIPAFA